MMLNDLTCYRRYIPGLIAAGIALVFLLATASAEEPLAAPEVYAEGWHPLTLGKLGSDFFDSRIAPPNGSSGAPRHGWLNTVDGFFTNEGHLAYDWTDGDGGEVHRGIARLNHPWSQRFWTGIEVPFIVHSGDDTNFGDVTLTGQVMLHETQDLSINTGLGVTFPTGDDDTGGELLLFRPQVNLWSDIGRGFSFRAGTSLIFDDDGYEAFRANVALGQTVTPHDRTPFGDFTWYVSANFEEPDDGDTFLSLTPGVRTHLGNNLFFLTGAEFPVVNRDKNFDVRVFAQFVRGF